MKIGQKAPQFELEDKDGKKHSITKNTILYFYPKDNTPGCTIEAKKFSTHLNDFEKLGYGVIGISGGTQKTKHKFCDAHDLKLTLLSDPEFATCKAYDSYGEKKFMGRAYMGIMRNTFIITNGKITHIFENVKPLGHVKELLRFLKE